ncbi:hypothetical protein [Azospirillum halopraeferens]|uniref:hypothetical protein n=1 Tax=Azospirillum halopraeferens TaxID=34010 RepID=UPI00041B4599|nr:hypothetical protein [Azospirillum halopraeferens]
MGWPAAVWGAAAVLAAGLAAAGPVPAAAAAEAVTPPAATRPAPDAVHLAITRAVPDLWSVEDVTLDAAADPGSVRFRARLRLTRPTFTVEQQDGPFTVVSPVARPGLEKILTGTASAAGDGAVPVLAPDNPDVLDGIGRPLSELPGHTVVAGTDEARELRARRTAEAEQRFADERARREREETLLAEQIAAATAEAERAERERHAVAARAAQITDLRARLTGGDRPGQIAAFEAALGGNDTALRKLAVEAALKSRDPVLAGLALRDWMARKRIIPVQLFATREDPQSETVLHNLGPLTVEVASFNAVSGALVGTMGAPGYSIARPSTASGQLAQTELALHAYGCGLTLRLSEQMTLDGLFRCQTLPTLVARVTLD